MPPRRGARSPPAAAHRRREAGRGARALPEVITTWRQPDRWRYMKFNLIDRITINPEQCGGRPCIRGMRIRVNDILEMLGEGVSMEEVLADFPDLEREDILACLQFAARRTDIVRLAA